jgi:hypothetical protein
MAVRASTEDSPSTQPRQRQKVHIRIEYTGKGPPGPVLTERCETLVRMLVEGDAGIIDERKAGDGAVDIYVVTRFAEHTIELARRAAHELGLADRATIKIVPERHGSNGH